MTLLRALMMAGALTLSALPAVPASAAEAVYDAKLLRLSEILGSLHFLRNLCGETGDDWRARMEELIVSEGTDPERRATYVSRFNRGYRAFAGTYPRCTDNARAAIDLAMKEGESLGRDLLARFGN